MVKFIRRLWASAYWLPRDLHLLWQARFPSHIIYCGGQGFGDDLLLTTVLEELRLRGHKRLAVISRHEELFQPAQPEIRFFPETWRLLDAARLSGAHCLHPKYLLEAAGPDRDQPAHMHIITAMCQSAGLKGKVNLKPHLHLQPDERTAASPFQGMIAIQCSSPSTLPQLPLKHWSVEGYQAVVDLLTPRFNFVQLGSAAEPLLSGVRDLRGRTSIRETAAILANARAYVGYAGFLMHLARAVDCPSAIVFGGREHPSQSGYACNENVFTPLPCSPCWQRQHCDFDHTCMTRITPELVAAAVERCVAYTSRPLPVETAEIPIDRNPFPLPSPTFI